MARSDFYLLVLSLIFPPLPVFLRCGFWNTDLLINVVLFLLGYLPGVIHAFYIISNRPPKGKGYLVVDEESDLNHRHCSPVVIVRTTNQDSSYGATN